MASSARYVDGKRTLAEVIELIEEALIASGQEVGHQGLDAISRECPCPFHSLPRRFELAAAVNRLRTVKVVNRAAQERSSGRPAKAGRKAA